MCFVLFIGCLNWLLCLFVLFVWILYNSVALRLGFTYVLWVELFAIWLALFIMVLCCFVSCSLVFVFVWLL